MPASQGAGCHTLQPSAAATAHPFTGIGLDVGSCQGQDSGLVSGTNHVPHLTLTPAVDCGQVVVRAPDLQGSGGDIVTELVSAGGEEVCRSTSHCACGLDPS